MIASLIIIGLAFIWLGYETDWMTVRLPYGAPPPRPQHKTFYAWQNKLCREFGFREWLGVLCDWEWACEHQYDEIPCDMELRCNGTTHKFHTLKKGVVKEIMRVNTKPHKPITEVYPPSHYISGITLSARL